MIVAGFGFRRAASLESLLDAFERASGGTRVAALATLADKADTPAFRTFAQRLDLQVHRIPADEVAETDTPTQSALVQATRHTGSVAEATALRAAGPGAVLLGTRAISGDRMASCALARAPQTGERT